MAPSLASNSLCVCVCEREGGRERDSVCVRVREGKGGRESVVSE